MADIIGNLRCLYRRLFFRIGAEIFLIIIIPAAFILVALAYNLRGNVRDVTLSRIEDRLKNKAETALGNLGFLEDDLSFATKHLEEHFSGLGGGVKGIANGVPPPEWYKAAKYKNFMDDLETMLLMNNGFLKVRVINNSGREIVRFDRTQSGIKEVPFGELEDKSGRDYFKNAMAYPAGKVYLHPITLDVEHGKILLPHTPVIRLCRKIMLNGGETLGILVLTVSPDVIFGPENRGEESGTIIIDGAGNYLRHRDPKLLLAGELGGKANIFEELPQLKTNLGKMDVKTVFDGRRGEYRVWRKVFYREDDKSHFWVLVERHPEFSIISGYTDILVKSAIILVLVIFAGFSLVMAVIYRSLRPMQDVTAAIRKLEAGDLAARAPTDAKNEIGEIADAFNLLAERLNQTALELQRSMALAKSISDIAPTAHIIASSGGVILSVNPAAAAMFGYTTREMLGQSVKMFAPSVKDDEYSKYIKDYLSFKESGLPENRNTIRTPKEMLAIRKNGEIFYVTLYIRETQVDGEEVFAGIIEDITERREVKIALAEAAENSDAIMNASNETLALIGLEGNIIAINEAGAKRLNASRADLVGKSLFQILPLKLALNRMEYFERVARTGKPVAFEDERDGIFLANSIYPVIGKNAQVTRFALFATDVTERKKVETEIISANRRYASLIDNIRVTVYILSPNGHLTFISKSVALLTGRQPDDFLEKRVLWEDVIVADDKGKYDDFRKSIFSNISTNSLQYGVKRTDGKTAWVFDQCIPILDDAGDVICFQGTIGDLTKFKEMERLKDDFYHAVVHDLKSPITGIQLELDMLGDQIASFSAECSTKEPCQKTFSGYETSLKQKIADIREGIDQLYLMIQSLLKLGEIEEEKLELHYEPFAMNDLFGELEHDFRGRAAAKGVSIECRNAFTGTVIADLKLLKRVLQNLVDNAIKYSLPNTAITIEASCAKKGVSCENIMVSVTNTGQPLTGNTINALFQKFKTHGHAESGSGIGLFFCQKTMNLLGGGIYVDQDANAITFHIFFPNG